MSILQNRFVDISSSGGNNSDELRLYDSNKVKKKKGATTHPKEDKTKYKGLDEKKHIRSSKRPNSSSSDDSEYDRRGQSLDRSIAKQQKKTLCFQRDKEIKTPEHKKSYKFASRRESSVDSLLSHNRSYMGDHVSSSPRSSRSRERFDQSVHHHNPYDPYNTPGDMQNELDDVVNSNATYSQTKPKETSRFQIGKRLLKGEIGIKSFNYYLLKEGLKSSKKGSLPKQQQPQRGTPDQPSKPFVMSSGISKSEENIYEEIYFVDRRHQQLQPTQQQTIHQQQHKKLITYPDCELCIQECNNKNCDICKSNELSKEKDPTLSAPNKIQLEHNKSEQHGSDDYGTTNTSTEQMNSFEQHRQNVLQYQSYNPNNPGVYKIETTPVAFTSEYNPIHHSMPPQQQQSTQPHQQQPHQPHPQQQQHNHPPQQQLPLTHSLYDTSRTKSSSSSDSLHHKYGKQNLKNEFYDYPSNEFLCAQQPPLPQLPDMAGKIYKTDSRASIMSETMSVKSESSMKYQKPAEMSDSSIGDSLFSYPAQRRYFGSAESCRFGYECRRCSYDGEKCSFSDNCRYECRNCDCSSSYFSSDFDENNFSRQNSARMASSVPSHYSGTTTGSDTVDSKTTRYAEDFIKHIANVKKNTIYQTSAGMTPTSSIHHNQIKRSATISNDPVKNASYLRDTQHNAKLLNDFMMAKAQQQRSQHRNDKTNPIKCQDKFNIIGDDYAKVSGSRTKASCSSKSSSSKSSPSNARHALTRSEEESSDSKAASATGTIPKSSPTINQLPQQQQLLADPLAKHGSPYKRKTIGQLSPISPHKSKAVTQQQKHESNTINGAASSANKAAAAATPKSQNKNLNAPADRTKSPSNLRKAIQPLEPPSTVSHTITEQSASKKPVAAVELVGGNNNRIAPNAKKLPPPAALHQPPASPSKNIVAPPQKPIDRPEDFLDDEDDDDEVFVREPVNNNKGKQNNTEKVSTYTPLLI